MYLDGNSLSSLDKEVVEEIGNTLLNPDEYPHTFAWFSLCGRYTPEKRNSWPKA